MTRHTGTNRGFTHTGWYSKVLNRFHCVLPRITGIRRKLDGKSRAKRERSTLLVLKKNKIIVDVFIVPQKVITNPYRLAIRKSQEIYQSVTQTYWNHVKTMWKVKDN